MKVIWEVKDIKPGRRYSKPEIGEEWIIGYLADKDGPSRYVSISSADGMVTTATSKELMAQSLTENEYLPIELL